MEGLDSLLLIRVRREREGEGTEKGGTREEQGRNQGGREGREGQGRDDESMLYRLTKADINGRLGFAVVDSGRRRGERRDKGGMRDERDKGGMRDGRDKGGTRDKEGRDQGGRERDAGGTRTSQLMTLGTKFVALPTNGGGPREA
jgi:hypothetical protein